LLREEEIKEGIREVQTKREYKDSLRTDWWKESALSEWEKSDWERRQGGKTRGCGE
jgi:hypothetical protein